MNKGKFKPGKFFERTLALMLVFLLMFTNSYSLTLAEGAIDPPTNNSQLSNSDVDDTQPSEPEPADPAPDPVDPDPVDPDPSDPDTANHPDPSDPDPTTTVDGQDTGDNSATNDELEDGDTTDEDELTEEEKVALLLKKKKLLRGANNNIGNYRLYINGTELPLGSSDGWFELPYTLSATFTASAGNESFSSGIEVQYSTQYSSEAFNSGSLPFWTSTPPVGYYYLIFNIPDSDIIPDPKSEYCYKVRVIDAIEPVVTTYSLSGEEISIAGYDEGAGITSYALSTSSSVNGVTSWTEVSGAPVIGNSGFSTTKSIIGMAPGAYYLYLKDASGNTTRATNPIFISKLNISGYFENNVATEYVRYFANTDATSNPTATLPTPSRTKFDFAGYYENDSFSGGVLSDTVTIPNTTEKTIYTKWSLKGVSFSSNLSASYEKVYDGQPITLSVGLSQSYASISWSWYKSDAANGTYTKLEGKTGNQITLKDVSDSGYIKAVATIIEEGEEANVESNVAHVVISKKPLTVTIADKSIDYDSPSPAFTLTATGFVGSDTVETVFGSDYASKLSTTYVCSDSVNGAVGTYPINGAGLTAANYDLSITAGTLTVSALAIDENTVVNVELEAESFGFIDQAITPAVTSVSVQPQGKSSISVPSTDYTVTYSNNVNVGQATVNINFTKNFSGTYSGKKFEITAASYTANTTINHTSWTYGETPSNLSIGVDNNKGGTVTYYYQKEGEETTTTTMPEDAGTYSVWGVISATSNYGQVVAEPTSFTINKRQITLTSASHVWQYDGKLHTASEYNQTGTFSEGQGFHSVSVYGTVQNVSQGEVNNSMTYVLTNATKSANYDIQIVLGKLSVVAAPLPVITSMKWGSTPGTLEWIAITRDGLNINYEIQLYKFESGNYTAIGEPITTTSTQLDVKSAILNDSIANGLGGYTATITARISPDGAGMYLNYTDGSESTKLANKYTSKVKVQILGGDEGILNCAFANPVNDGSDNTVTYLLQGQSANANINFKDGYEVSSEAPNILYTSGASGSISVGSFSGGHYPVTFTTGLLAGPVDATLSVKSKDSAPSCSKYQGSQASDYTYVKADFTINDILGLAGYKIVSSVGNITDDGWTDIPKVNGVAPTSYSHSLQFTEAGPHYLVFKDTGGNIRYYGSPITVYSVSFDKNASSATGSMPTLYKLQDYSIALPANGFTYSGYVFTYWTAGDLILPDRATYVKNESVVMKAGWTNQKFTYKVNYFYQKLNNGNPATVSYSSTPDATDVYTCAYNTVVSYNEPSIKRDVTGYTLTNTPEGIANYNDSITVTEDDVELNIYYALNSYTMTYTYETYDNSQTKTIVDTFYYNQTFVETEKPSRTGYDFIGWNYGDAGSAPAKMPAANLTATGYFDAKNTEYIIRYYFENIDYDNSADNYLSYSFGLNDSIQADEHISADYGRTIKAYVSGGTEGSGYELVKARSITGFTPVAVIVSYENSEAKTFATKQDMEAFVNNTSYDSDLTHKVYSQIDGTLPYGVTNGPTIVSYYYTRNIYTLSMDVYKGNRDNEIHLFGAYYDGTAGKDDDKAIWIFPYGYAFANEDATASNIYKASYFETYGFNSQGLNYYDNDKTHSKAWTNRWYTADPGAQIAPEKYYLASFIDWSTGSRPTYMPAGDVKVVREYATRELAQYKIELYLEGTKSQSITYKGHQYNVTVAGNYTKVNTFVRYIAPGKTVSIVDSGTENETTINVATLMEQVDYKSYYVHNAGEVAEEVLSAQIQDNQYDDDNNLIPSTVTVLKLYMSRKYATVNVGYYYRTINPTTGGYNTAQTITSYTLRQKWGTSYGVDPEYYYYGESGSIPTGESELARSYIGDVVTSGAVTGAQDFSANHFLIHVSNYSYSKQYSNTPLSDNDVFRQIGIPVGTSTSCSITYYEPGDGLNYYVRFTYKKKNANGTYSDAPLTHTFTAPGESSPKTYRVVAANKFDVFNGNTLKPGFREVSVTYQGVGVEATVNRTGTFYIIEGDQREYPLLISVDPENNFQAGIYIGGYNYNSAIQPHVGRELFDAEENQPQGYSYVGRGCYSHDILATGGVENPIDGTSGEHDYYLERTTYYFDCRNEYKLIYHFAGESRTIDYGTTTTVPAAEIGFKKDKVSPVFESPEGYEIVWYRNSECTQLADQSILVNTNINLYGKQFNKPVENFDIAYYELPDSAGYYTGNLSSLYAVVEQVPITYSYDSTHTVAKTGTITKYYNNQSDMILYATKKSHFVPTFTEFSMPYLDYELTGYVYDEKNLKNVLKSFCSSSSVNLRAYYSRTWAQLVIRRNDSFNNNNDEITTRVNGSTVTVPWPTKNGYDFTGWKLYDYTGGIKGVELDASTYGLSWSQGNSATFKMPICPTLIEANWTPAAIPFEIVHLYQDNNKTYNQQLLDDYLNGTNTTPVVTAVDGNFTHYYSGTANINNLFATVESVPGVKSEDVIAVADHNMVDVLGNMFTLSTCTYEHVAADSGELGIADTYAAYYNSKVTCYYTRENNIVIQTEAGCIDSSSENGYSDIAGVTLSGSGNYFYGQSVSLYATMQPSGYTFKGWYLINGGIALTDEQKGNLAALIADAGNDGAVLTKVSSATTYTFDSFTSGIYLAVTEAEPAVKPTVTITCDRDLDTNPLYYNYVSNASNQFNAAIDWGTQSAGANNIKQYKWYYINPTEMTDSQFENLNLENIDTSSMTAFADSNTSTFNLPTGYNAGYYVLRCVADIERKDNGRTETAEGSIKFKILPNHDYVRTTSRLNQSYTGQAYSYTEEWLYTPNDFEIYYSEQPFTLGEDLTGRTDLLSSKPEYRDVIVDSNHNPIPHVVYYYVVSNDPNYASIIGFAEVGLLPVPVSVTPIRAFTKIYDGTATVQGKPGTPGDVTYKYSQEDGIYSDFYRLQTGIETPGAAAQPYYKINGILSSDNGKVMMLNFNATFDNKHVDDATIVTLTDLWVLSADSASDLHNVYENWNYVFPTNLSSLQLSGQIKPYTLDVKWLPYENSSVDGNYNDISYFNYLYSGYDQAPYIKIIGDTSKIPDPVADFSIVVKNKQKNTGTYDAVPEVEEKPGANYKPTDYTFTLQKQTYNILQRQIKVSPKDATVLYNGTDQTLSQYKFETRSSVDEAYSAYSLPSGESFTVVSTKSYKHAGVYDDISTANLNLFRMESGKKVNITDNYDVAYGTGTLTINPRPVAINGITGVNKEYDGNTDADLNISAATIKLASDGTSSIYSGDTLTLEVKGTAGQFNSPYVGTGKPVSISYALTSGDTNGIAIKEEGSYLDYVIDENASQSATTANIIKSRKSLASIAGEDTTITYGTTLSSSFFDYTITGLVGGETITSDINIASGYPKLKLMRKLSDGSYENAVSSTHTFTVADSLDFIGNLNVGKYYVFFDEDASHNVNGFTSEKYDVTWDYEHPVEITVAKRLIRVEGNSGATPINKAYDGTTDVTASNMTTMLGTQSSHPSYNFTAVAGNSDSGVLSRDAAGLVITSVTGAYNTKNVATADKINAENAVLGGDVATNYQLDNTSFNVPASISPIQITVTVKNQTVTYGNPVGAYDFNITGAVAADVDSLRSKLVAQASSMVQTNYQAVASPAAGKSHNVGFYALSLVPTSADYTPDTNYTLDIPAATGLEGDTYGLLTVEKKALRYKVDDVMIRFGRDIPPTSFSGAFLPQDFEYNDTLSASDYSVDFECNDGDSPVSSSSLPGEYAIKPINTSTTNGNYRIQPVNGTLTIGKFYMIVEGVTTDPAGKLYDGTTTIPSSMIDTTGLLFTYYDDSQHYTDRSLTDLGALASDFTSSLNISAVFVNAAVGDNKPVNVTITLKPDSYLDKRYTLITSANQAEASTNDYSSIFGSDVTQTATTGKIRPNTVTIKPNKSDIYYGQPRPVVALTDLIVTGLATGETINNIPGFSITDTITPNYVVGSDVGTYTVDISGSLSGAGGVHGNYNIVFETDTFDVLQTKFPAPTGITWTAGTVSWSPVASIGNVDVAGYKLILKEGTTEIATVDNCTSTSYDFTEVMRANGQGNYKVEICAIASLDSNDTYKNVQQYGDTATSGNKKAVLVTPVFASDAVTVLATTGSNTKKVYVNESSKLDSYVVIAGETTALNAVYNWTTVGAEDATYNTGYILKSFEPSVTTGITTSTVIDSSATGSFTGKVTITDAVNTNSVNLILTLKKKAPEGNLTIAGLVDTAAYGATTHEPYSAVVTHQENVEYDYSYEWYYVLNGFKYDKNRTVMDTLKYIDSDTGNIVEQETPVVWNQQTFTFPRGKRAQEYDVYCKVTITRKDNGESTTLTANKPFTVVKPSQGQASSLILTVHDWTYGQTRQPATATRLYSDMGAVTIYYRPKDAGNDAWTTTLPTNAGVYEAQARSAETTDYPAVTSVNKEFTIARVKLDTPANFDMYPIGGAPYGLLKWDAVTGFEENAGVSPESTVTVEYEIKVLLAEGSGGQYGAVQTIATEYTTGTNYNVSNYIDRDGNYDFTIRAIAKPRTTATENVNCEDSDLAEKNTPIIGVDVTTDYKDQGNTKEYDGSPITITAEYSDGSGGYTYQWFRNGSSIDGATNKTYTIKQVGETDYYSVQVHSNNTRASGSEPISSKAVLCTITKRPITLTATSYSKVYDNTALTKAGNFTWEDTGFDSMYSATYTGSVDSPTDVFPDGAKLGRLTFAGTITEVGNVDNVPSAAAVILGSDNITDNYDITYASGTLTVTKKQVTITAPDASKEYDGTPLTSASTATVDLLDGHSLAAVAMTAASTITEVSTADNVIDVDSIQVVDTNNSNHDVTANYEFDAVNGVLTVTKANPSITVSDKTFTYDGQEHTISPVMTPVHDTEQFRNAAFEYAVVTNEGGSEVVGTHMDEISFIHAGVYTIRVFLPASDNHFAAAPVDVTLTINQRPIGLTAVTKSKTYDGAAHTVSDSEYSIDSGSLATGDTIAGIDVYNAATAKFVGETESSKIKDVVIKNTGNENVTTDYSITLTDGTLSFDKRPITVKATNHSKKYDGIALTVSNPVTSDYILGGEGLVTGDVVDTISITGSQLFAGSSNALPTGVVIKKGDVDVTNCYDITSLTGVLTVTKRTITVTALDHSKPYDATAMNYTSLYTHTQMAGIIETSGEGLVDGDYINNVRLTGSRINVGTEDIVPSDAAIVREDEGAATDSYDITYANGHITITPVPLTVTAGDDSKKYNGTPLTYEGKEYSEKASMITVEGLCGEDAVTDITLTGSRTEVGTTALVPSNIVIERNNDVVTGNYIITYHNGSLTIEQGPSLTATDLTITYDGQAHSIDEIEKNFVNADPTTLQVSSAATELTMPGEIVVTYTIPATAATLEYTTTAKLKIVARPITFSADSATKIYDGQPLRKETFSITAGTLAEGDAVDETSLTVAADNEDGEIVDIGSVVNKLTGTAVIMRGAVDVTAGYDITYADGLLRITDKPPAPSGGGSSSSSSSTPVNNKPKDNPELENTPEDNNNSPSEETPKDDKPKKDNKPKTPEEPQDNSPEITEDITVEDFIKFIIGTTSEKDKGTGEIIQSSIMDCLVLDADMEKMIDELLTDEQKKLIRENKNNLRFRVQVTNQDEKLTEEIKNSVNETIPENVRILGLYDINFFVKIGGEDETQINSKYSSTVNVSFDIPDSIWNMIDGRTAQILRTYINSEGQYITEVAVDNISSKNIVMDVDNYSSYTVVMGNEMLVYEDEDSCVIHWFILLTMIIALVSINRYYHKRKKQAKELLENKEEFKEKRRFHNTWLLALNVAGIVLLYFGDCDWDLIAELTLLISSLALEAYKARNLKKYVEKLAETK